MASLEGHLRAIQAKTALIKQADLKPSVKLREHQEDAADAISSSPGGSLLYHGIGTGKTLSAIAAREADGRAANAVVPAALRENFKQQLNRFVTDPTEGQYSVNSYNDAQAGKLQPRPIMILDEVQRLRNQGTAYTEVLKKARDADKRILLSGTPLVNGPEDMASIINLLHGRQMYSPETFKREFVNQTIHKPFLGIFGQGGATTDVKNSHKLHKLLDGRVHYVGNDGGDSKPQVTSNEVHVDMTGPQVQLTRAMEDQLPMWAKWKFRHNLPPEKAESPQLNAFSTGMRQIALSPYGFDRRLDPYGAFQQSSKLQRAFGDLQTRLKHDPKSKVMVYSNFIDAGLSPYMAALDKHKVPYVSFTGNMSDSAKRNAVTAYNSGTPRVVLISPAGSEGISLRGTTDVQMLDHHWNQARTDQAKGRAARLDSHLHLPIEDRKVNVTQYMSNPKVNFLARLLGQRPANIDNYLASRAKEKQEGIDKFLNVLRDVGDK